MAQGRERKQVFWRLAVGLVAMAAGALIGGCASERSARYPDGPEGTMYEGDHCICDQENQPCARFTCRKYRDSLSHLRCEDGRKPRFALTVDALRGSSSHPPLASLVDLRDPSCSEVSRLFLGAMTHLEQKDGMFVKTTFAGEDAVLTIGSPRSLNLLSFRYDPQQRSVWEGRRYVLLRVVVEDERLLPMTKLELGFDAWGVGYLDVWASPLRGEQRRAAASTENTVLEHLYRVDLPAFEGGDHVLVFGQGRLDPGAEEERTVYLLDGREIFTSRAFYIPDLFVGHQARVELPGDAQAVSLAGVLGVEPLCLP